MPHSTSVILVNGAAENYLMRKLKHGMMYLEMEGTE
jgi:hypothetical protein